MGWGATNNGVVPYGTTLVLPMVGLGTIYDGARY